MSRRKPAPAKPRADLTPAERAALRAKLTAAIKAAQAALVALDTLDVIEAADVLA